MGTHEKIFGEREKAMGGATWNGLYLKSDIDIVSATLLRLAKARHFGVSNFIPRVTSSDLENAPYWDLMGPDGRHEVIALLAIDNGWTRLIGLELVNNSYPRLFFSSETVMLLGCDAFECGFYDREGWWYFYYEQGLLVDCFHSNLHEPVKTLVTDISDPNDLRTTYLKCFRYSADVFLHKSVPEVTLPLQVTSQFVGHPEKLISVLRDQNVKALEEILHEESPELAIERLRQVLSLPYIGEFQIRDIARADLSNPYYSFVYQLIEWGLTLIVLDHPKNRLL
jgi:hypothetical protein